MKGKICRWIFVLINIKNVISNKLKDDGREMEVYDNRREELNGLEYLGIGYNVRESMPLGNEEEVVIDPGYKEPVIAFEYVKKGVNETDLPKGLWIRREELCNKTILMSKGKRKRTWVDVLKEDIKVNILESEVYNSNKFQENVKKILKKEEANIYKMNCSIYTTGMILSQKWKMKESILILLNKLERMVNEHKKDEGINVNEIKEEWKEVFNRYGTHVMTKMALGGKIIEITNKSEGESKEDKTGRNKSRIDLSIFNMNIRADDINKEEGMNKEKYKKILIIGGSVSTKGEEEISKKRWIKSIKENPVPIKFELTPLGYFIYQNFKSLKLLRSYEDNLREYVK